MSERIEGTDIGVRRTGSSLHLSDLSSSSGHEVLVASWEIAPLVAWLRKTYPEHFAEGTVAEPKTSPAYYLRNADGSIWVGTVKREDIPTLVFGLCADYGLRTFDTRTAVGVVPDVNAAREYADHIERAAAAMQRINTASLKPVRRGRGYDKPHSGYVVRRSPLGHSLFRVLCTFCNAAVLVADLETHIAGYHGETKLAVVAAPESADVKLTGER